jgi:hypothetical protein
MQLAHWRRPLRLRIEPSAVSIYASDRTSLKQSLSGGDNFGGKSQLPSVSPAKTKLSPTALELEAANG